MEEGKKSSSVSDVGAWAMNVISSVGIIMANKQLMSPNGYAFSFATTLTGFHFAVTALVGMISNATGYSASKHVPVWELLWFSIVANTSITGMNLSLMLNSVGFYQISKLSMIPVVCVMEWILHSKNYSREVKMAVFVVVLGVAVCTVTDVKVNAKGFVCACVAVLSTSLQQILAQFRGKIGRFGDLTTQTAVGIMNPGFFLNLRFHYQEGFVYTDHIRSGVTKVIERLAPDVTFAIEATRESIGSLQKKYSIGSFELLSKTAPIQALSLIMFGPFIDYYLSGHLLSSYKLSYGATIFILLSCTLAVFCNVSQYLCIGRFSAVSFQVLGHMKTVCVLTLGWLLFDSELSLKNILGMGVAVLGMMIYSWAVEAEKQGNAKIPTHTKVKESLTEEDIRLLKEGIENAPMKKDIEIGQVKS